LGACAAYTMAFWLYLNYGSSAVAKLTSSSTFDHFDFETFWYSARAFLEGRSIYDTGHGAVSSGPPLWTVLISPLGLLEPFAAYKAYAIVMVVLTVGYLAWTAQELKLPSGMAVAGAAMLLLSMPTLTALSLGQTYPVLALGLVAAWVADRRGKDIAAGAALGLVIILKPSLAPLVLWPLVRRRWDMCGAVVALGTVVLLLGVLVVGPAATLEWLRFVAGRGVDEIWTNASLPGQAKRLFAPNDFAGPIVQMPWTVPAALVLGAGLVILTAVRTREDPEMGLWALVAASLLASPVAWENYMLLLGPGVLLLIERGRWPLALLLLSLQTFPSEWALLWQEANPVLEALALALYSYILTAHWISFLVTAKKPAGAPASFEDHGKQLLDNQM
jgi:alpha-1,2-mannosyltransferase